MELIGWQSENTCKLIFSLAGKKKGGYKYVFRVKRAVKRAGKRLPEKYIHREHKVQLS